MRSVLSRPENRKPSWVGEDKNFTLTLDASFGFEMQPNRFCEKQPSGASHDRSSAFQTGKSVLSKNWQKAYSFLELSSPKKDIS